MKINVVLGEGAFIPEKAHKDDAGYDLRTPEDFYVAPQGSSFVDTGVHIGIPSGYVGMIKSRSSLYTKGLRCEGVIDAGYTGPIGVTIYNDVDHLVSFNKGDKIAQLVILPIPETELVIGPLNASERGDGGFGSTGR